MRNRQPRHLVIASALSLAAAAACAAPAQAQIFVWAGGRARRPSLDSLAGVARRDSLDPNAHYRFGLALLDERKYDSAESALNRAVRIDPRMAPAYLALSVVQDENGRHWSGLRHTGGDSAVSRERAARDALLRRAFLLDPLVNIEVLIDYGDRRRFGFSEGPRIWAPELYWQAGLQYEDELFAHGTQLDSLPPGLLWIHGLMSAQTTRYDHAIRDLTVLVRGASAHEAADSIRFIPLPTNDIRYVLAAVHQRAGHRTQALFLFQEVAENDIGNYMAHVQLARLHEDGREWGQAVNSRRAAIAANPDDPTLLLDLAASLLNARRPQLADSVLTEAAPQLTNTPRLYYLTGLTKQELTRYDDARAAFETFLRLAPTQYGPAVADARSRLEALPARP